MRCPVCGGDVWRLDPAASAILALGGRHAVVLCAGCRQRRLDPLLAEGELEAVYSGAYFRSSTPVEGLPGVIAAPADYSTQVVESRLDKFAKTLRTIRELCPNAVRLLDVGAATGDFVRAACDFGFDADGIEVSEFAVEQAARLNSVHLQRLLLADLPGRELYDAVHLNHVFEHFNDPLAELAHLHRLLRRNGVLYLEVPYQFNIVERAKHALRPAQSMLTLHSLHHAYFYRPVSLARLVAANGFRIQSLSVFDPARYPVLTKSDRAKRWMWRALALLGIGNYIELYAVRT